MNEAAERHYHAAEMAIERSIQNRDLPFSDFMLEALVHGVLALVDTLDSLDDEVSAINGHLMFDAEERAGL